MKLDDKGNFTLEGDDLLVKILLPEGCEDEMWFNIPGTVPHWLTKYPERRRQLAEKLRTLAEACEKKEWPFELGAFFRTSSHLGPIE
jgi:hypothetical protein